MFLIKEGQEWKGKDEKEEGNKGNNYLAKKQTLIFF